ncbi:unnamed protein product, partial [Gulo gulo]
SLCPSSGLRRVDRSNIWAQRSGLTVSLQAHRQVSGGKGPSQTSHVCCSLQFAKPFHVVLPCELLIGPGESWGNSKGPEWGNDQPEVS